MLSPDREESRQLPSIQCRAVAVAFPVLPTVAVVIMLLPSEESRLLVRGDRSPSRPLGSPRQQQTLSCPPDCVGRLQTRQSPQRTRGHVFVSRHRSGGPRCRTPCLHLISAPRVRTTAAFRGAAQPAAMPPAIDPFRPLRSSRP